MMLNSLPPAAFTTILDVVETASKRHGARDRALFAIRQNTRLRDIADFSVGSVTNPDGTIRRSVVGFDGKRFELSSHTQAELRRFILAKFELSRLDDLSPHQVAQPLFSTQKTPKFTPNTIAQHFSHLDSVLATCFQPAGATTSPQAHSTTAQPKKSLLSRFGQF